MSIGTPGKQIPRHLDPRKMAQQRALFTGRIPADALPRLVQAVESVREINAEIQFEIGDQGEKVLQGTLVADLDITCQRCLEPMPQRVVSEFSLAAVWSEEDAIQLASVYDPWITGEGEGDLYDILEEELLLSLPLVAYHEQDCVDKSLFSTGEADTAGETEKKPNPFQVLQQLKGNIKK